ncbi:MAG: DUF58 domain-containing protein [Epsilonproteobacteria bacterium]|nr:DUF58 domain-containing protein [Campylobacterota bacterium]
MKVKAKEIILKTRKNVFGDMLGNNASIFHGEGFEFAEIREYQYGDDVRKIDWKTTAKLKKPYVKIYHEEREINVVVSTMFSGSTYFGTTKQKSEYMAEILAILGFSAVNNKDKFSHILFADKLYHASKPSKKIFSVYKEVERALEFNPLHKEAKYKEWVDTLFKRIKKRSLIFLIGDFIGEVDLRLLAKKHDLFVIIVRDYFEENPKPLGYLSLVDPETLNIFEGDVSEDLIKSYKKAIIKNDRALYKHFRENSIRFVKLFTNEEPYIKIAKKMV